MSVKANWFAELPGLGDDDPFTDTEAADEPAELANPQLASERLRAEYVALLDHEAALFNCGITCPIRDSEQSICSVCPLSVHADPLARLAPLCRLGRRMDRVQTELTIAEAVPA